MIPGEYFPSNEPVVANAEKSTVSLIVRNTGDRPIQVGSHTHFFEANKFLEFPRDQAYGCHLNIPAGTSVRFEPGESKNIELTEFGGKKIVYGFSGLVNGPLDEKHEEAIKRATEQGFKGLT
nr:urease subunit beta [Nitrosopumilus sp.]